MGPYNQCVQEKWIVRWSLTVLVLSACLVTFGCGGVSTKSINPNPNPGPNGPVQMEVLFPPTGPGAQWYADVQTYLVQNPNAPVDGGNFAIKWADVDLGGGVYDFSTIDPPLQTWISAGKKANLVVWATSDSITNSATPQYVWNNLTSANYTTCNGEQIPNYFSPAFQTPYQNFMAAVAQHYGSMTGIGYIRFGLGRGGEAWVAQGFGQGASADVTCTDTFLNNYGWTAATWSSYLQSMLTYEAGLHSPKQLMLGIVGTSMFPDSDVAQVVATAVAGHIGFGSQGLQASDITSFPNCISDWCNLFNQYSGQVPLELQTVGPSDPTNGGQTGSFVPLLPFAASHQVNIMELYFQDWLIAYDPNYPGNGQYGAAYAQAIQAAATGK